MSETKVTFKRMGRGRGRGRGDSASSSPWGRTLKKNTEEPAKPDGKDENVKNFEDADEAVTKVVSNGVLKNEQNASTTKVVSNGVLKNEQNASTTKVVSNGIDESTAKVASNTSTPKVVTNGVAVSNEQTPSTAKVVSNGVILSNESPSTAAPSKTKQDGKAKRHDTDADSLEIPVQKSALNPEALEFIPAEKKSFNFQVFEHTLKLLETINKHPEILENTVLENEQFYDKVLDREILCKKIAFIVVGLSTSQGFYPNLMVRFIIPLINKQRDQGREPLLRNFLLAQLTEKYESARKTAQKTASEIEELPDARFEIFRMLEVLCEVYTHLILADKQRFHFLAKKITELSKLILKCQFLDIDGRIRGLLKHLQIVGSPLDEDDCSYMDGVLSEIDVIASENSLQKETNEFVRRFKDAREHNWGADSKEDMVAPELNAAGGGEVQLPLPGDRGLNHAFPPVLDPLSLQSVSMPYGVLTPPGSPVTAVPMPGYFVAAAPLPLQNVWAYNDWHLMQNVDDFYVREDGTVGLNEQLYVDIPGANIDFYDEYGISPSSVSTLSIGNFSDNQWDSDMEDAYSQFLAETENPPNQAQGQ